MTAAGAPPRPPGLPSARRAAGPSRLPRGRSATALDPEAAVRASQDLRFRRSITLLALTLVLPGSAQLVRGRRRVGQVVLALAGIAVLTVGAVLLVGGPGAVVGVAVRPGMLTVVRIGTLLVAGGWALLLVDAWRLGEPPRMRRGQRLAMTATALGMVVVVATPLALLSHYARLQDDLVSALFPSGEAAAASDGRLNVLLLGGDAAEGRPGLRTDSMNLVSVDVATGRAVIVGMPRNIEDARFPAGTPLARAFPAGFHGEGAKSDWLLNAVYSYATEHPELVPGAADPGAEGVKEAVAGTLGLHVHYYVLVNLGGFKQVVDALGGIALTVEEDVPYGRSGGVIAAGAQKLNGREALWYARSRTGSSDYVRMHRQRCVLGALLHEANPSNVLRRFGALADSAKGVITTDVPQAALPQLVDLAVKARGLGVESLQMSPPLVYPGSPDLAVMHQAVLDVFAGRKVANPPAPVATTKRTAAAGAPAAAGDGIAVATATPAPVGDVRAAGGASSVEAACSYR